MLPSTDLPLTTPTAVALSSGTMVSALLIIKLYSHLYGPSVAVRRLLTFSSLVYSTANIVYLFLFVFARTSDSRLGYIYHLSKFYEYIDLILVSLSGTRITWSFAIHHFTTPYWTLVRCIRHPDTGFPRSWKPFAMLNALHHAIMYANFGGVKSVKWVLKYTQALQLTVGLAVEVYCFTVNRWSGQQSQAPHVFAAVLLGMYFVFFVKEFFAGDYDVPEEQAKRRSSKTQ